MGRTTSAKCYAFFALSQLYAAHAAAASSAPDAQNEFARAVADAIAPEDVYGGGTFPTAAMLTHGNRVVRFLSGTPEVVYQTCALIESAQQELLLQTYEWDDNDESARLVFASLEARVARALDSNSDSLQIRLLIDNTWPAFGTKHRQRLENFVASLAQQPLAAHHIRVELSYYEGFGFGILHSKTVIQDGVRALVMTGNFKTAGGIEQDFYNMGVLLEGGVAESIREDWMNARGESVVIQTGGPLMPAPEPVALAMGTTEGLFDAAVLTRRSSVRWRDASDHNPQNKGLLAVINAAHKTIDVLNPALNVEAIKNAIVNAVSVRRVRVNMVLSLNMDRELQHYDGGDNVETAYALYNAILAKGGPEAADRLRIYWASTDGQRIAASGESGNLHAKAASFDDTCLWVGSMNWDKQSWSNSRELSVVLMGRGIAEAWQKDIFGPRRSLAVPLLPGDLPEDKQDLLDPVFRYLNARKSY